MLDLIEFVWVDLFPICLQMEKIREMQYSTAVLFVVTVILEHSVLVATRVRPEMKCLPVFVRTFETTALRLPASVNIRILVPVLVLPLTVMSFPTPPLIVKGYVMIEVA